MIIVDFKKLHQGAVIPTVATAQSAGMDLYACLDLSLTIEPFERILVPTGFSMALPVGFEAQIRPRSGLAFKEGITVVNAPGTIDADYRGEVKVALINLSSKSFIIEHHMRIAQMVIAPFTQAQWQIVETLGETSRSDGGFGSTGT